jgi:hypothetical protein
MYFGPMPGFSTIIKLQLTRCCHTVSDPKIYYGNGTPTLFPDLASNDFWLFPKVKPKKL